MKRRFFSFVMMALVVAACAGIWAKDEATPVLAAAEKQAVLGKDVVRLHILAKSDSPEDQALKLVVRDALLLWMDERVADDWTSMDVRAFLSARLDEVEAVARQAGAPSVKAEVVLADFPDRLYGDLIFPAGEYWALRVAIAGGAGANWWCVLFPPLCLTDEGEVLAEEILFETPKAKYTSAIWNMIRRWYAARQATDA